MINLTLMQVLGLLGVPSVASILTFFYKKIKENQAQTDAVKLGVQALLRSQMINDYNRWSDRGYAPIYARENFENCWIQYESLGTNGVMNNIHEKFMELPTQIINK